MFLLSAFIAYNIILSEFHLWLVHVLITPTTFINILANCMRMVSYLHSSHKGLHYFSTNIPFKVGMYVVTKK